MTVTFRKSRFDRSLVVGSWLVVGGAALPFGCAGRSDTGGGTGGHPDGTYHGDNVSYDGNVRNGGTAGWMVGDGRAPGGQGGTAGWMVGDGRGQGGSAGGGFTGGGVSGGGVSGSGLVGFDGSLYNGGRDGYPDGRVAIDGSSVGARDGGHPSDGRDGFARDGRDGFAPDGFGPDGDPGGDGAPDGTSWSDGAP